MRRRLQSFSLAACKDKATLKTAFDYDNVALSNLNKNKWNPALEALKPVQVSPQDLAVRMNCINEDDLLSSC